MGINVINNEVTQIESNKNEVKNNRLLYALSNTAFFIYFFFVFYGTTLPFREKIEDAEDLGSSNIVNQIVFGSLLVISILTLVPKWKQVKIIILREKFFSLFLLWAFISILWSSYPDVSFKRYIQYLTTFTVSYSALIYTNKSENLVKYFKILLGAYVLISFASIFTIPGARDRFGIWQGLAASKNHLGMMGVIAIIFFTKFLSSASLKWKPIYFVFLLITISLFVGSNSFTSLLSVIIILLFYSVLQIDHLFRSLNIGRFISIFIIVTITFIFMVTILFFPDVLASIFGAGGRDLTLTGRTDLWASIFWYIQKHLLYGCGFQGFWVVDSPQMSDIYSTFVWLPIQAHNGYIDIINETGLIGFLLFLLVIIQYFKCLSKVHSVSFWQWLFITALIINLTESILIRPRIPLGSIFIFSYLTLFSDISKEQNINGSKRKLIDE